MCDDVSIIKKRYLKSQDDYIFKSKELLGKYELVEDEEIYQDGALNENQAIANAVEHIFRIGDWVVMREIEDE